MLTRHLFKRDFRIVQRYLSDKPTNDGKVPETQAKDLDAKKKAPDNATEKIQNLLKSMMAEPKISENEYREKFATAPVIPNRQKRKEISVTMEKIEENLTKAAGDVAKAIGGDVKQTESELLSRVLGKINQTSTSLSDLLVGMKVDRTKDPDEPSPRENRGQQVKRLVDKSNKDQNTRFTQRNTRRDDRVETRQKRPMQSRSQPISINIFSGEPLGIFRTAEPNYGTKLDMWESLKQRELSLATAQPPANYFEKMIVWTEQGKVWKFPIDNEQGLEEEKKVHFSEHIFLDAHLEGWCPDKGPIRHFMELVCVGLSKNAFYTVKEKKDHIMWYKEYFETKKDLLTEVGAWDSKPSGAKASL